MGSTSVSPKKDWISPSRWSRSQGTAVNCVRCVSSCRHTHRRKSWGSTSSSRSTWTMFGATEKEPSAAVLTRRESLVAGAKVSYCPRTRDDQDRQRHAQFHAGDLAADGAEDGPARGGPRRSCILSSRGFRSSRNPATFRRTPARAVHHQDGGVVDVVRAHTSEAPDVFLRGLRMPAQLRDDLPGLVAAHLGARPHKPCRGRHREIPVDHLGTTDARHASTVRERVQVRWRGVRHRMRPCSGAHGARGTGACTRTWGRVLTAAAARQCRGRAVQGRTGPPTGHSCRRPGRRRPAGGRRRRRPCPPGCSPRSACRSWRRRGRCRTRRRRNGR